MLSTLTRLISLHVAHESAGSVYVQVCVCVCVCVCERERGGDGEYTFVFVCDHECLNII